VIEHGVFVPEGVRYTGELARGIVVVNHLRRRGRRLGADVFERARKKIPLDLVGMDAESLGGLGEVNPLELAKFEARYRFFFNPIRYTSLGLAVIEAMMIGLPVVGLATTEMATAIEDGVSGFVATDPSRLVESMRHLLDDPAEARWLGENARRAASERFAIDRFAREWEDAFSTVVGRAAQGRTAVAPAFGACP
jgi:glycosyltransferase involved in cell wall biosynthesis